MAMSLSYAGTRLNDPCKLACKHRGECRSQDSVPWDVMDMDRLFEACVLSCCVSMNDVTFNWLCEGTAPG